MVDKKIIGAVLFIVGIVVLIGSVVVLNFALTVNQAMAQVQNSDLGANVLIQGGLAYLSGFLMWGILWTIVTMISGLLNIIVGFLMLRDKI